MSMMTLERETPRAASWPPAALRGRAVLRHWRSTGIALWKRTTLLAAGDLDPGFSTPSAAFKKCLDPWRASTTPTATHSHVSLVDVTNGGYIGLRDNDPVNATSSSKVGIMYPVVQLIHDLTVIEERVRPPNSAALYQAARDQWARDLVDAGAAGNLASARAWLKDNGPKLERCAKLSPTTTITPDASTSFVLRAADRGHGRYLSTEVAGGFTGRVIGMYAIGGDAAFDWFDYEELA